MISHTALVEQRNAVINRWEPRIRQANARKAAVVMNSLNRELAPLNRALFNHERAQMERADDLLDMAEKLWNASGTVHSATLSAYLAPARGGLAAIGEPLWSRHKLVYEAINTDLHLHYLECSYPGINPGGGDDEYGSWVAAYSFSVCEYSRLLRELRDFDRAVTALDTPPGDDDDLPF